MRTKLIGLVAICVAALTLVACKPPPEEMVGTSVVVLNYANVDFYPSVSSLDAQGTVNGNAGYPVGPRAGGGKSACCVSIPLKWHPGIKVAVQYHRGDWPAEKYEMLHMELPPYPDGVPDRVWVSLFPDGSIEVVSSMYGPEDEGKQWPGKIKKFPE
jgi:Protein of unknown function (DUF3304)